MLGAVHSSVGLTGIGLAYKRPTFFSLPYAGTVQEKLTHNLPVRGRERGEEKNGLVYRSDEESQRLTCHWFSS